MNSNSRIISTDEDPSSRIEVFAIINLRGVSTRLNNYTQNLCLSKSQSNSSITEVEVKVLTKFFT